MKIQSKIQTILIVLVVSIIILPCAYGIDGQIEIEQTSSTTFPIIISQSGSYVLTSSLQVADVNVDGIRINVSDVTLDLNGHTIIGPGIESGFEGNGIYANSKRNITILNGIIKEFSGSGVNIYASINNEIKDIKASNNGGDGIHALSSIVFNCSAYNNGGTGIESSTIANSAAYNNGENGFTVFGSISNCSARDNNGIGIHGTTSSTIINCNAYHNGSYGIKGYVSTIKNCGVYNNADDGIQVIYSTVIHCVCDHNEGDGIESTGFSYIKENNLTANGYNSAGYGLLLSGNKNYVIMNAASQNSSGSYQDNGSVNYMPIFGVDTTDNCNH